MLTTKRLILRSWKESDLVSFAEINADPKAMEYFPALLSREESDACVQKYQKEIDAHGYGLWAVELKATGQFIGFIGIRKVLFEAPFTPAHELGWRLAVPFWGHGYATEGARAAMAFGFEQLGLPKVVAFTVPMNVRSRKVMERLGMHEDGLFEHPFLPEGHRLRTHVFYTISSSEL
jgi:3-dehydroquinate dehydratase/shikimate dehydrogenase